jgi:hypothetical protein
MWVGLKRVRLDEGGNDRPTRSSDWGERER